MLDQTGTNGGGGADGGAAAAVSTNETKHAEVYGSERGMALRAPTYSVQELEHTDYRGGGGGGGWKSHPHELAAVRSPREMANDWVQSMPVELPAGSVYWKFSAPRSTGSGRGHDNGNMI